MRFTIAILVLLGLVSCQHADPDAAHKAATEYAKHVPEATGVECVTTDSDHDGYCSCTVFRGNAEPMQIQCGCQRWCINDANCARGCKYVPSVKVQGRPALP